MSAPRISDEDLQRLYDEKWCLYSDERPAVLRAAIEARAENARLKKEPYELAWHAIAKVLKDEAWEGRWKPLDESNVGPLAGVTASALIDGFARLGLRLVAIEKAPAARAALSESTEGREPTP